MKIRIKGNSVRYRLSQTDVALLTTKGYHEEQTVFGPSALTYALVRKEDGDRLTATYEQHKITVAIPAAWLEHWAGNDVVGFDSHMPLAEGDSLFLLVEKDFKCIDDTTEDQSDNYDNPNQIC
ncbi:DUF7009 family protein [Taibaiella koreensis]|uniref:DUF7009 family protein n=1 Tax=Taibaiella koreensis TaxID=1268548 RepID=UPI000E59B937|nr:hypothetical protein [Taibaiella koreensis]